MNRVEFRSAVEALGVSESESRYLLPLLNQMHARYAWLDMDEIYAAALRAIPKGVHTYNASHGTKLATWLALVVRTSLCTFIESESRQRNGSPQFADPAFDALVVDGEDAQYTDGGMLVMAKLDAVLSPYAMAMAQMRLQSRDGASLPQCAAALGVSVNVAKAVRDELEFVGSMLKGKP